MSNDSTRANVVKYLVLQGKWVRVNLTSEGVVSASDAQRTAARSLIYALDYLGEALICDPALDLAVAAGLIAAENKTSILALSSSRGS